MNVEKTTAELVHWLQEKLQETGAKGFIMGLSGGVDSAVVSALVMRATENCLGIIMPCGNVASDAADAEEQAKCFNMPYETVDLKGIFEEMTGLLEPMAERSDTLGLARSNIKPRLRMTTLYYLAQSKGYLVVGTGNKSELTVGYFTKYGDGGVDLLPLGDMTKKEVYELGAYLGVTDAIMNKAPSAGLWAGQTDEKEMGFSYQQLGEYIESGSTADAEVVAKIQRMEKASAHKRSMPPIFTAVVR